MVYWIIHWINCIALFIFWMAGACGLISYAIHRLSEKYIQHYDNLYTITIAVGVIRHLCLQRGPWMLTYLICPMYLINRGYYMVARRYEIYLRVLKNISQVQRTSSEIFFSTQEEKFRISKRPCNVLFII